MKRTEFSITILFFVLVLLSAYGMLNIIIPYTSWEWDVDFLLTKQFIIHLDHYRGAFYIHIFSSLVVLFSGGFLFSKYVLRHYTKWHRILGKTYIGLLLLLAAPSGMVMAYYANGGIWVKVSFLILTSLWWYCTLQGYRMARKGEIINHKRWMIRSYALTLSAISLRGYQFLFGQFDLIDPAIQYVFVSWVSWVGNLLLAELIISTSKINFKQFDFSFSGVQAFIKVNN